LKRFSGFLCAALLVAVTAPTLSAQQTLYMWTDAAIGDQGGIHVGEFKLKGFSNSVTNEVMLSSTSLNVGKASFAPAKVSMTMPQAASASFYKSIGMGTRLATLEIRLYNNSTNRMFYKTVYENVYLTKVGVEGADENVQQLEFIYQRVRFFASPDATGATPPAQIGCWDVLLVKIC